MYPRRSAGRGTIRAITLKPRRATTRGGRCCGQGDINLKTIINPLRTNKSKSTTVYGLACRTSPLSPPTPCHPVTQHCSVTPSQTHDRPRPHPLTTVQPPPAARRRLTSKGYSRASSPAARRDRAGQRRRVRERGLPLEPTGDLAVAGAQ
eukprot:scaffold46777_cov60-Phaeocystis_antarctica.AAC.2